MHYKVLAANRINLDTIDGGGYSSIRILSKRETSPKIKNQIVGKRMEGLTILDNMCLKCLSRTSVT